MIFWFLNDEKASRDLGDVLAIDEYDVLWRIKSIVQEALTTSEEGIQRSFCSEAEGNVNYADVADTLVALAEEELE